MFKVCSLCNFHSALNIFYSFHICSLNCVKVSEKRKKDKNWCHKYFLADVQSEKFRNTAYFSFLKKQREEKILSISLHNYRPYEHLISNFAAWLKAKKKIRKERQRSLKWQKFEYFYCKKLFFCCFIFSLVLCNICFRNGTQKIGTCVKSWNVSLLKRIYDYIRFTEC